MNTTIVIAILIAMVSGTITAADLDYSVASPKGRGTHRRIKNKKNAQRDAFKNKKDKNNLVSADTKIELLAKSKELSKARRKR